MEQGTRGAFLLCPTIPARFVLRRCTLIQLGDRIARHKRRDSIIHFLGALLVAHKKVRVVITATLRAIIIYLSDYSMYNKSLPYCSLSIFLFFIIYLSSRALPFHSLIPALDFCVTMRKVRKFALQPVTRFVSVCSHRGCFARL